MAETELQSLVELNKQFEEVRVNSLRQAEDRASRFEEQRLHSQNMEKQILEMKEILISMAARHRVQASSSKDPAQNSPSTPVSQFYSTRCERIVVKKLPDQVAHQVFDETPKSENAIELEQIDESLEDGGEALFEIVLNIKRGEERPTKSDEKDKTARAHSITNGDEGLIEDVLKIVGALEQDLAAHHVLEGMTRIIDESIVDELDFKITTESLVEELNDVKDFEVSDLNHVTSLSLVENMAADLVRFLRKPPNQEEIVMDYIGVLCFDLGGNFVGVLLERHTVDYDLSCNCCLNPIEWVNWVAYMLRAHTTEDVVKCELLKCFDMKGCLISIFLDNKILSDKHSSYFVTTFLSSKWVGNSVTSKEVWKSLAKRYLMIVDNKEFASDKYWKYDMGTTLWCWETHDYLFHFANSLVNLEPSSSKEKNGDATQGLEGSDVESVSDTIDMENSYADVGSLFGIAPKTCFSIMHLGEGHYSVALYCRRNHQIPENTSYLEVAPALAADCAAILKHSELASLTCLELGQVCKDVGLPAGVLNILTGLGPEVGAPLASHPVVDKIAFTGSNATGSKIMSSASQVVKPVTMELGGKSLIIVFEDADLDKAVEWTAFGCFRTNGQICSATSRLIVHENIATAVVHGHREGRILIFIFDPGGIVKLNTQSGWRLSPTEFFMALLLRFLYAYIIQFMILGDKDHLKEGVLLQDYRGLGWFYYYRPGFSYFL